MLVRECYTEPMLDSAGAPLLDREGLPICLPMERWIEMPGVVDEAAGMEADRLAAIAQANEAIRQQLDALDLRYGTRALTDALNGDRTRLEWLEAEKAKLRAQFVGVSELVAAPAETA